MILSATKADIDILISSFHLPCTVKLSDGIEIKGKVGLASISFKLLVKTIDGDIELDIEKVEIAGLSVIALARKAAGEAIIDNINKFPHLKAIKNKKGNISISVDKLYFTKVEVDSEQVDVYVNVT